MQLDYKDIIIKHYALSMSGSEIARQSHPQFHHSIYDRFQVFSFYPEHIKCHIQAFILWLQLTKESFFSISFSSPSS